MKRKDRKQMIEAERAAQLGDCSDGVRTAPPAQPDTVGGGDWVPVPREPTEAIQDAMYPWIASNRANVRQCWRDALAAAPKAPLPAEVAALVEEARAMVRRHEDARLRTGAIRAPGGWAERRRMKTAQVSKAQVARIISGMKAAAGAPDGTASALATKTRDSQA